MTTDEMVAKAETIFAIEIARSPRLREAVNACPGPEAKLIFFMGYASGMLNVSTNVRVDPR